MKSGIVNARVTFHNSPIHVLERFIFKDMGQAYEQFRRHSGTDECVILQTCNRVELFATGQRDMRKIKKTWASLAGLDENAFDENLVYAEGAEACRHLLRLTSGLDSMVVGEEQILGQVKDSISGARHASSSGERLNTLFDKAIRSGTRIRNSTGIGRGGVSVGSMAVRLAEENVDDLKSKRILLIGTGEIATLVTKSLTRRGYAFDVTSRNLRRAGAFCEAQGGGRPVRFEDTISGFGGYDVILVATTAPYSLVTYERITAAIGGRPQGMMILDLSNPRTVDERVATLSGVKLMNLDQIAEMVDRNMKSRIDKVKTVEDIISGELEVLEASMNRLNAEPLVREVFKSIDALRVRELQKALRILGEDDADRIRVIDELTRAVVEGIVSTPMNNLRRASEGGETDIVDVAGRLFDYAKGGGGDAAAAAADPDKTRDAPGEGASGQDAP